MGATSYIAAMCPHRPTRGVRAVAGIACVCLIASPAWANPGTAAWTGLLLFVFGNLVIGLVEGGVAKAFGARWWAFPALLVGNYFSGWCGLAIVWGAGLYWSTYGALGGDPLRDAIPATWLTFAALTLIGVVIETPFYWLSFLKTARPRRARIVRSILVANAISAVGLAFGYAAGTRASLVNELAIAPSAGAVAADIAGEAPWVYYIAPDGHEVRRVRPDGSSDELVRRTVNALDDVRLVALQAEQSPVMLALTEADEDEPLYAEIVGEREISPGEGRWGVVSLDADVGATASVFPWDVRDGAFMRSVAPPGPAADLRPPDERSFDATFHWDGWVGIRLNGEGVPADLALDSPFIKRSLTPFGVSILPGDVLVFELAHEWDGNHAGIYIASLRSRTIAPLIAGRNPVVVYPHDHEP